MTEHDNATVTNSSQPPADQAPAQQPGRRVLPPSAPTVSGSDAVPPVWRSWTSTPDGSMWERPRIAAGVVFVALAACVWLGMAPDDSYEDVRAQIESTDDGNNARAEGAPQQAVVNGWTTIEYLNLLSAQQEQADDRRDALLLLGLIGGAVAVVTTRRERTG